MKTEYSIRNYPGKGYYISKCTWKTPQHYRTERLGDFWDSYEEANEYLSRYTQTSPMISTDCPDCGGEVLWQSVTIPADESGPAEDYWQGECQRCGKVRKEEAVKGIYEEPEPVEVDLELLESFMEVQQ